MRSHYNLYIAVIICSSFGTEGATVTTKYGTIEGTTLTPEDGGENCHGFLGIPFAQPPLGPLRFQKPEPLSEPWVDIFSATKHPPRCLQAPGVAVLPGPEGIPDSEDCLYLNVVSPSHEKDLSRKLAVMVWIHGGGFLVGSAYEYDPEEICRNLVSHDVIVVTVQYRLDIFGFVATGDQSGPGNFGLHDQIQALKWVHENIADFGGDPTKVTIFGESAGGASVSLLSYIEQAQSYFQRAIAQSGSGFGYWTLSNVPVHSFHEITRALGCGDKKTTNQQKLECLRGKSVEEIQQKEIELFGSKLNSGKKLPGREYIGGGHGVGGMWLRWSPTIDNDLIPLGGLDQLAAKFSGKKPFITGTCQQESLLFVKPTPLMKQFMGEMADDERPMWIDNNEDLVYSTMEEAIRESVFIAKQKGNKRGKQFDPNKGKVMGHVEMAAEYAYITAHGSKNNKTLLEHQLVQLCSDTMFNYPCILDAEVKKRAGAPVWVYNIQHYRSVDFPPETRWKEAQHACDLPLLFTRLSKLLPKAIDENDAKVGKQLCKMWTEFAKNGDPNGNTATIWPQYESLEKPTHLRIKVESEISSDFHRPTVQFWTLLFPKLTEEGIKQESAKGKLNKQEMKKHSDL